MFPTQLLAQETIDGYSPSPADEKCQGHEEKRQAILNSAAFSLAARQEKAVFPVGLLDCDQHEDGQSQGKGSREEPYEKGKATKEFGEYTDNADGFRYLILLLPIVEGVF
jgi:hypothetical protein